MTGIHELTPQCSVHAARDYARDALAWLDGFACLPGSWTRAMLSGATRGIDCGRWDARAQVDYAEHVIAAILAADLETRQGPFPIDYARDVLADIAAWKDAQQ